MIVHLHAPIGQGMDHGSGGSVSRQFNTEALPDAACDSHDPFVWLRRCTRPSRTLLFASRWMPDELVRPAAGIYAYCRTVDALTARTRAVKRGDAVCASLGHIDGPGTRIALLETWREASRRAFDGELTGHRMIDQVMADAARNGVSWRHIETRLQGVHDELLHHRPTDYASLRRHHWNVTGSIGAWLIERAGVRDPVVIDRAHELGHAMQLTNLVVDVGDDLERGRLQLPDEVLSAHGLSEEQLAEVRADDRAPLPEGFIAALELLMQKADRAYAISLEAAAALPGTLARAVIVAARIYQGHHDALRNVAHDSLRQRVHLDRLDKVALAAAALSELARMDRTRLRLARRAVARPVPELVAQP